MTVAPTWEAPPGAYYEDAPGDAPGEPPRRWTPRRVVAALLSAALLVSAAGAVWWWRNPDPVFTGSYGMRAVERPGETVWTALVERAESGRVTPVRLTGLKPVFAGGEQSAWVDYHVCDLERRPRTGFGSGLSSEDVERSCVRTAPAEGATFPAADGRPQALIVGITRTQPGVARVTGHEVSFRQGWQWGTDELDVRSRVLVRK